MARRPDTTAATETLHEIESVFDRAAGWVASNPSRFFALVGIVLAAAAGMALQSWWSQRQEGAATTALAKAESAFFTAMGAPPGTDQYAEPANPETARRAREQAVMQFLKVAEGHAGTTAGVQALLAAGNLQAELGDAEAALSSWEQAAQQAPTGSPLAALALVRWARGLESAGRWSEAAARHAEAAEIEGYPLRSYALADAARCYAEAGERERAVALFERLETEAPNLALPSHVRAQLEELQARARP